MAITTASAKSKGRRHQQWTRDRLLSRFPLADGDIRSTSMGVSGEDLQFSPRAREMLPISVECKAHKAFAVYKIMEQAEANADDGIQPVSVIKADRKSPLVVVDAEYFFDLLQARYGPQNG